AAAPAAPASDDAPSNLNGLSFQFVLDVSNPPVAAMAGSASPWPLLRLLLQSQWKSEDQGGHYATPYPLFSGLSLKRVWLSVEVKGLKDVQMKNDESSLIASKPFEPFGNAPSAGSGFSFAHEELAVKCLDSMTLNFQWMKYPAQNLGTYYKNYPGWNPGWNPALKGANATDNTPFKFTMNLLDLSSPTTLTDGGALFDPANAGAPSNVAVPVASLFTSSGATYKPDTFPCDYSDHSAWRRYWRLELNTPDFQQDVYPSVASAASLQFASAIAAGKNASGNSPSATDYQINPPYTPTLKTFSVDYTATVEVNMAQYPIANQCEQIYYQHPFGYAEISPDGNGVCPLLPVYDNEGELYLGLEGVVSDQQTVSLLFQLADGSANPDLEPQPVQWSYLSGNQWLSLQKGQLVSDGTQGLNETGIMQFQLPQSRPNTLLPADLYWLRAAVAQDCDSLCDTISIDTQAVCATWVDQGNLTDHLNQPLPALTITQTVNSLPGIAAITQPYTSFGGKPSEDDSAFYIRVSERLRHKQRALTFWDYEHLILNQFPEIYTAKCIPPASTDAVGSGQVTVVVIPDICNKKPANPFAPKVSSGLLEQIQTYLADCLPPLATVTVKNPTYIAVKVRFEVSFMPGCDPGFYTAKLNDELCQFLSPWAYDDSSEVVIGGNIYANNIINFLECRSYVDYVAGMELFKSEDGLIYTLALMPKDQDAGYCVSADYADGVLVSARQHAIDQITEKKFEDSDLTGIGYMEIGLDFIVAPDLETTELG
ncbi:MAG: baseplate J/gp47 family protein, partial [Candidatus Methylumidiphilus sp.]